MMGFKDKSGFLDVSVKLATSNSPISATLYVEMDRQYLFVHNGATFRVERDLSELSVSDFVSLEDVSIASAVWLSSVRAFDIKVGKVDKKDVDLCRKSLSASGYKGGWKDRNYRLINNSFHPSRRN